MAKQPQIVVDESLIPMVGMLSQILSTLNITIPLMVPTQSREDDYDDLDVSRPVSQFAKMPVTVPSMGELLFPSFNLLIPNMVEFVLPTLS